ncbi:MAG: DNA-directed RNA polymerase subunit omega [Clostridiales bacterium]|jgi:DNA-directed RNA polymerase subunit omega|nr:DNA-directed RNA polymerase subunit omega [Clostridiales bacterium]
MLHPSYAELLDILNADAEADDKITSRYSVVVATAKRARELVDGKPALVSHRLSDKAVSIAVREIAAGKIKIKSGAAIADPLERAHAKAALARVSLSLDLEDELDDFEDFEEVFDEPEEPDEILDLNKLEQPEDFDEDEFAPISGDERERGEDDILRDGFRAIDDLEKEDSYSDSLGSAEAPGPEDDL